MKGLSLRVEFAKRYNAAAYTNPYIRFINKASRIGVSVGVAALLLGLSIMNGFERELKSTLLSVIPDIEYEAVAGQLQNWQETYNQINYQPGVVAAAPYIKVNGMVQKQDELQAVIIHGVDSNLEKKVNKIPSLINQGRWIKSQDELVLGQGLATKLKVAIGDEIELLIPQVNDNGKLKAPKYIKSLIVGTYQMGGQMDFGQVFLPLSKIQQAFNWSTQTVEGIKVEIEAPFLAQQKAREIGTAVTDYVYILDWFRTQGHVYNDIVMVRDIMYLVMILVMAVACFNIVSSLTMAVQEKHGDIGILKTMGLADSAIKHIFVLMGMLTAIKGIVWGLAFGIGLSLYLPDLIAMLESVLNFKALDASVYFIDSIPSQLRVTDALVVSVTAFVIALLSSYLPARRASKLKPVELIG